MKGCLEVLRGAHKGCKGHWALGIKASKIQQLHIVSHCEEYLAISFS